MWYRIRTGRAGRTAKSEGEVRMGRGESAGSDDTHEDGGGLET